MKEIVFLRGEKNSTIMFENLKQNVIWRFLKHFSCMMMWTFFDSTAAIRLWYVIMEFGIVVFAAIRCRSHYSTFLNSQVPYSDDKNVVVSLHLLERCGKIIMKG